MKTGTLSNGQYKHGITLMESIVVICILSVLVAIVAPTLGRRPHCGQRISCINNLKQIGTAYRIWANDNNDKYPWQASIKEGGMNDVLTNSSCAGRYAFVPYAIMADELGQSPRVVRCPTDSRQATSNFNFVVPGYFTNAANENTFGNLNLSYFTGLGADDSNPQAILAGDRNLGNGGFSNEHGTIEYQQDKDFGISGTEDIPANQTGADATINTNGTWFAAKTVRDNNSINYGQLVGWSAQMHSQKNIHGAGNILLGDGSAQQVTSDSLRTWLKTGAPHDTNGLVPAGKIRLLFP